MKSYYPFVLLPILLLVFLTPAISQDSKDGKEKEKKEKSDSKIKPYEEIITEKAISDEGLFDV
ncbi:MAG: hypothetical protein ACI8P3_004293, partial [Saprospiraceae bacterium]